MMRLGKGDSSFIYGHIFGMKLFKFQPPITKKKVAPWKWGQKLPQKEKEKSLLHSRSLTWNLKMMVWKMIFLFQRCILRFHVKFQGCIFFTGAFFVKFRGVWHGSPEDQQQYWRVQWVQWDKNPIGITRSWKWTETEGSDVAPINGQKNIAYLYVVTLGSPKTTCKWWAVRG